MLETIGKNARKAEPLLRIMDTEAKNRILRQAAEDLCENSETILLANAQDMERGRANGMTPGLLDRLLLTRERICQMAEGLRQLADLEDPVGEVIQMKKRPNGLLIGQKRVPLGVIGIIYEARPNVTADAFGLCFKTGNAVILKGGSDALDSNMAIVSCLRAALEREGADPDAIQLITDTSRETTKAFMWMYSFPGGAPD